MLLILPLTNTYSAAAQTRILLMSAMIDVVLVDDNHASIGLIAGVSIFSECDTLKLRIQVDSIAYHHASFVEGWTGVASQGRLAIFAARIS